MIVPADSASGDLEEGPLGGSASLFRLDGSSARVRVILSAGTEGCVDAALEPAPDRPWGAGLVGGSFGIQRVDSLGAISRQDSTALSAVVFRFASTVPNSTGGRFAGLPFSLADLWRVPVPGGGIVVVATTKRQINQEDSPLEERTLIVLESDSTYAAPMLAYSTRSTGPEETVEGSELLAAVTTGGSSRVFLVFAHDFGDQTSYSLVERSSPRGWKLWWASRRFSC